MRAARNRRQAELAKIHIAKKELGLDDETYRAMLWTIARVDSAAQLDSHGRHQLLDHLSARGFKGKAKRSRGRPHNADRNAQILKIEALLTDAGRTWAYVDAMCAHMFRVDRVVFANPDQLHRIIAALTYDQKRRRQRTQTQAQPAIPMDSAERPANA